ncbi:MAG: hypothetical protein IKR57_06080 [Bacilli bacterium]|nr:hypothetical protein [Bacilli bacterium]
MNQNNEPINNVQEPIVPNAEQSLIENHIDQIKDSALKKREKKKTTITVIIASIVALIILISLFIVFWHFKGSNTVSFDDSYDLYQYFTGIRVDYKGKVTISRDGSITKISSNEQIDSITDVPIYFGNEKNSMLTTQNMQIVFPRYKSKNYKLKFYTRLYYDEDNKLVYFKEKEVKKYLESAFLYNGDNLYIFFDEIEFKVDDKEYKLSPLSYIIVNYKDQVEFYDKLNDKYTVIESHDKDIIVEIDGYKINLSTDMYYNGEDSVLLVKNVSNLKEYNE